MRNVQVEMVFCWGTSEWSAAQIVEAHGICEHHGWAKPKVEQPQYSMLWRERVEGEILAVAEPRGIGLVVWSPLAMGMLTGKHDDGVPEGSRFAREAWARVRILTEANVVRVRRLKPITASMGVSRAQLALAWALHSPAGSSVIIGATRPEQVDENVGAADLQLSAETVAVIEEALAAQPRS